MENAFVELKKAATIILERLPEHPDYNAEFNSNERHNIGLVSPFLFLIYNKIVSYVNLLVVLKNLIQPSLFTVWPENS